MLKRSSLLRVHRHVMTFRPDAVFKKELVTFGITVYIFTKNATTKNRFVFTC